MSEHPKKWNPQKMKSQKNGISKKMNSQKNKKKSQKKKKKKKNQKISEHNQCQCQTMSESR